MAKYPSPCTLKLPVRVYEHMPFEIAEIITDGDQIICYNENGKELKRFLETDVLEVK